MEREGISYGEKITELKQKITPKQAKTVLREQNAKKHR